MQGLEVVHGGIPGARGWSFIRRSGNSIAGSVRAFTDFSPGSGGMRRLRPLSDWGTEPARNVLSQKPQQAGALLHPGRPYVAAGAREPVTPSLGPGLGLLRVDARWHLRQRLPGLPLPPGSPSPPRRRPLIIGFECYLIPLPPTDLSYSRKKNAFSIIIKGLSSTL